MLIKNLTLPICLIAASASFSHAADHPCAIGKAYSGVVESGARAEMLRLVGHAQKFGLAGVYMPEIFIPAGNLTLYVAQSEPDRYGRLLAQAYREGIWLQGKLLIKGEAAVYGIGQSKPCSIAMLREEKKARLKNKGVWGKGNLLLKSNQLEELAQKTGQFIVVRGRVMSVGDRIKRVYLNFGQNWSQDFTVSVVKKGKGAFKGEISTLTGLKNRIVEVRGIVEQQKGPLMRVIDEAQIEIID